MRLVFRNTRDPSGVAVMLAHLRARQRRSVGYGFPTAYIVQLHLHQDSPMLHLVCLLNRRGSPFGLYHPKLLLPIPMIVCASSVAFRVTTPGTVLRIRINWLFLLLVVVTINPATTMLDLMVVGRLTTLI